MDDGGKGWCLLSPLEHVDAKLGWPRSCSSARHHFIGRAHRQSMWINDAGYRSYYCGLTMLFIGRAHRQSTRYGCTELSAVQCSAVQRNAAQRSAAQRSAVQCSAVPTLNCESTGACNTRWRARHR